MSAVVVQLDPIEHNAQYARAGRLDVNPVAAVVAHERVGNEESALCVRRLIADHCNAVAGVIADDAVLDGQGCPAVEAHPVAAAETDALDGQAAQADVVAGPGIDRDADEAARDQHAGFSHPIVDDADALGDVDGAVAARVEHADFAERERLVMRALEGAARRQPVAVIAVVAERRDPSARELRLGRSGRQPETERHRDKKEHFELDHDTSPLGSAISDRRGSADQVQTFGAPRRTWTATHSCEPIWGGFNASRIYSRQN